MGVVRQGLARDGGLYIPRSGAPSLSESELTAMLPMPYTERAVEVLKRWVPDEELSVPDLRTMVEKAYTGFGHCGDASAVAPVVHLEGNQVRPTHRLLHLAAAADVG